MLENIERFFKRLKKNTTFISTRTSYEFVLQKNNLGKISTETFAIQRIVNRAAVSVEGIASATASIDKVIENAPLKIRFNLELNENHSVQDVSKDLVAAVRKVLEEFFSIIDVEIYVRVTDVSRQLEKKKRRVR